VVRVAAVVNVQDGYQLGVVVDGVPHAVFAALGPPVALEWPAERSADSSRFLGERAVDELKTRPGHSLREPVLELPDG